MPPEATNLYNDNGGDDTLGPKRVIIAGGGPCGVLAALFLLGRNGDDNESRRYHVTLLDDRENFGKVSLEQLSKHRSWMIGLSTHGLTAIREIPGLFEDYVSKVGVELKGGSLHLGSKEIKTSADSRELGEGYIVDRNYVVWALQQCLEDRYGTSDALEARFHTKLLYVDADNKRVLVRRQESEKTPAAAVAAAVVEEYLDYDILLGCDGIRSAVRSAIQQRERQFECRVSDIFSNFKSVHIALPKNFDPATIHLLPACVPSAQGIALPEKGNMVNLSMGHYRHKPMDPAMSSDDPAVVAEYMKKTFKAFELVDYDDFARQWTQQGWNTTGQVHCNFYHSERVGALLLGDSAHATSPSIGMGMNTALADASALNRLLDEHKDDWSVVFPLYSKERVKEGRALSDLAFYLFSIDEGQALRNVLIGAVRSTLHRYFPNLVWPDPFADVGLGTKLSVVYERATRMGLLSSVRRTNDALRLQYEEETFGMISTKRNSGMTTWMAAGVALAAAGFAGFQMVTN